jgi:hypothetical protein
MLGGSPLPPPHARASSSSCCASPLKDTRAPNDPRSAKNRGKMTFDIDQAAHIKNSSTFAIAFFKSSNSRFSQTRFFSLPAQTSPRLASTGTRSQNSPGTMSPGSTAATARRRRRCRQSMRSQYRRFYTAIPLCIRIGRPDRRRCSTRMVLGRG